MKKSPVLKIIAIILAIFSAFQFCSFSVYAAMYLDEYTEDKNQDSFEKQIEKEEEQTLPMSQEKYIKEEINRLRTKTSQDYLMSDGSFFHVEYPYDIHETNEEGKLIPINNELEERENCYITKNEKKTFIKDKPGYTYTDNKKDFSYTITKMEKEGEVYEVSYENIEEVKIQENIPALQNIETKVIYETPTQIIRYTLMVKTEN